MAFRRTAITVLMAGTLAACGGGDSDDPALSPGEVPAGDDSTAVRLFSNGTLDAEASLGTEIPIGVYQYTTTVPQTGDEFIGLALISQSGRLVLALQDDLAFARVQLQENDRFEAVIEQTIMDGEPVNHVITGGRDRGIDVEALPRISGSILNEGTRTLKSNYRLDKQEADNDPLSASLLAATYSGISEEGIGTAISLSVDGTLVGSDTTGCDFTGQYVVPDAGEDVFEVSFAAENCGPTSLVTAEDRNGQYFAVGRGNVDAKTISFFATNGKVGARFNGSDTDPENSGNSGEQPNFYGDDFDEESTVTAKLESGVYDYIDVPLDGSPAVTESGLMFVSDTGRVALATNSRLGVTRVRVNDVDTYSNDFDQVRRPGTSQPPSAAETIFGTPDNSSGGGTFRIAGSLLDGEDQLVNRYTADRDNSNDPTFAANTLKLTNLAATYSGTRNPGAITATLTFDPDGTVTGSDTTGCVYNGTANIPDGFDGILEVRVTASNCSASTTMTGSERNGTYNGVGDYLPGSTDQVRLVLASRENVEYLILNRQ